MKIDGIGYIPSEIKWMTDYIIESFCDVNLEDSIEYIEIWGTQSNGYEIEFKLLIGMIVHIDIKGRYFIIYASLLECQTLGRKYLLKKWGLEAGFKEIITRMKVLMLDEIDSFLKVKKK